jgi:undecaprenyl-diphosphatase
MASGDGLPPPTFFDHRSPSEDSHVIFTLPQTTAIAADSTTGSVDYSLFRAINGLAGRSRALDEMMISLAKYSPLIFAAVLVALWVTWSHRNQRGALLAGISALVALGLGQLVGMALPRERPYLTHRVALLITHSPDTSFPSDHTTLAFAIAMVIVLFNRRLGLALLAFGLVVAYARVFVGAHYPGDVLGGAVLGALTGFVLWKVSQLRSVQTMLERIFELLARIHLAARF